jgi:hypothetical protein
MRELETGQRPEWNAISDQIPIYKSFWAQWKSLALRNGVLVRHWESADGKRTAQVVIPRSRVKEVLTEMHGGTSGGHLEVNKTIERARQRYYLLHLKDDVERWCQQCNTCAASRGPRTRSRGLMYQCNVAAPFERIAIDIAGPFPESDRETGISWSPWTTLQSGLKYTPSKPRGIDSSGRSGDRLLLTLRCPNGPAR